MPFVAAICKPSNGVLHLEQGTCSGYVSVLSKHCLCCCGGLGQGQLGPWQLQMSFGCILHEPLPLCTVARTGGHMAGQLLVLHIPLSNTVAKAIQE